MFRDIPAAQPSQLFIFCPFRKDNVSLRLQVSQHYLLSSFRRLYHDGDFFSKDNIKPGYCTLHPRGIHHGPHPKALANQRSKTHTDEYAVMLDGLNPIHVMPAGEQVEWKEYWASWMEKKEEKQ